MVNFEGRPPAKKSVAATKQESSSKAQEVFKANLPKFEAVIRGNVVADGETFTSKAGKDFYTFRLAYTRFTGKGEEKETMFVKVMDGRENVDPALSKGNYVEVSGAYHDELGEYKGELRIYRTLFVGDKDTVKVLIG